MINIYITQEELNCQEKIYMNPWYCFWKKSSAWEHEGFKKSLYIHAKERRLKNA